ncbi:bifunctional methylenetetrahydrofolate dehydrogenase/methenyltetrahydrofolate cyclohydrolase FolD [Pseudomonas sp. 13B_2.1_Bac1]|uniref:bifunctional methylenetetrahydrofolate dehydrogenase/methenyltetrahydrofolate cyclohydrolase FolD n=1 Tax=Pseudomonas sp. 13B_2.1_Bac1 TaxID=2971624 RepID=UPI0021C665E2|nr:bifunctional methylenetetrahydrofolate dehydrogenase/methenyltetrahydrofolate cyclohydrolase FolD [Pseudomonas sp. 13B_2.1_Bac1]MCU1785189.1 bifunctional methylenetetrahydrofolate dehydrogenase/methenyltetrahydrofolate cyclohydrolase FolD [Pseudomonas sp. 13B_2.1_Bac1]
MTATLIDGKALADRLRRQVTRQAALLLQTHGLKAGLAIVLVGEDPASDVYVRNKIRQARDTGLTSLEFRLPAHTSENELLALIGRLNEDSEVHGILVQLPLPPHIDEHKVIHAVAPAKDVDGFHPVNIGQLSMGQNSLIPCTPYGVLLLLRETLPSLEGLHAVVIGRSNIVGKPMAQLLLAEHCTITIAHSRTRQLADLVRSADIVIAAVGKAHLVRGDWIKPGACVIDVGINRVVEQEVPRLVGDVAFNEALEVAGSITPVPGGVGPMTLACLLRNTLIAACAAKGLSLPRVL